VLAECAGVALIGLAALLALALGTFAPSDPVFESGPVANRAGVIGASAAALLFGILGLGAVVLVASLALLGGRLALGLRLPRLGSRFWVAAPLLLLAAAALPPLLDRLAPGGRLGELPAGWLGHSLANAGADLLGTWGALLVAGVVALVGLLGLTGISSGTALRSLGLAIGWLLGLLAAASAQLAQALSAGGRGLRSGARTAVRGIGHGVAGFVVWREQRRRRARVAAARAPEPEPAADAFVAVPTGAEAVAAPSPPRLRAPRGDGPVIVDHSADPERKPAQRQAAFQFEERPRTGPYQLPDVAIFQRSPTGSRQFYRDSLIMNSRML
jgi:hypothetical protein